MIIDSEKIEFYFPKGSNEKVAAFFNVYDLVNFDFASLSESVGLRDEKDRVCRYCSKKYPEVTFKKKAHTIPEFLGNKGSLSDFECDSCNKRFGEYEKQLSNYIGVAITLNRTKGKRSIPTAISHDNEIIAKKIEFFDVKDAVELSNIKDGNNIKYNPDRRAFEIDFKQQPYVPIFVFKALLKMAYGLLPEEDLKEFDLAVNILNESRSPIKITGNAFGVVKHILSHRMPYTGIFLFKNREPNSFCPPYTFVLFYGQIILQIFISFSKSYIERVVGKVVQAPILIPFIPDKSISKFHYYREDEILDSLESKSSFQKLIIEADVDVNMEAMDIITRKLVDAKFDPNNAKKIIFVDDDFKIDLNSI